MKAKSGESSRDPQPRRGSTDQSAAFLALSWQRCVEEPKTRDSLPKCNMSLHFQSKEWDTTSHSVIVPNSHNHNPRP